MNESDFKDLEMNDVSVEDQEKNNLNDNLGKIDKLISKGQKEIIKCDEIMNDAREFIYDKVGEFHSAKSKKKQVIENIENLKELSSNPYFGHMYLEEKEKSENVFVGNEAITDENGNYIVYDWRAPVVGSYYQNFSDFKYKNYEYSVIFKRQIDIKNKKMIHARELYNVDDKSSSKDINDYFLRKVLRDKKNQDGFTDIIKSIQSKQNEIIRNDLNNNIICQGVAGSGKTVIIVHRLSYLLYNNPTIPVDRFLYIAPNDNFKSELNDLNKKLGIDKIKLNTIDEYYLEKFNDFYNYNQDEDYYINRLDSSDTNNSIESYTKSYLDEKYKLINDDFNNTILNIVNGSVDFNLEKPAHKNIISIMEECSQTSQLTENTIKKLYRLIDDYEKSSNSLYKMNNDIVSSSGFGFTSINSLINNFPEKIRIEIETCKKNISTCKRKISNENKKINLDYDGDVNELINTINKNNEKIKSLEENNIELSRQAGNLRISDIFLKYNTSDTLNEEIKLSKKIEELENNYLLHEETFISDNKLDIEILSIEKIDNYIEVLKNVISKIDFENQTIQNDIDRMEKSLFRGLNQTRIDDAKKRFDSNVKKSRKITYNIEKFLLVEKKKYNSYINDLIELKKANKELKRINDAIEKNSNKIEEINQSLKDKDKVVKRIGLIQNAEEDLRKYENGLLILDNLNNTYDNIINVKNNYENTVYKSYSDSSDYLNAFNNNSVKLVDYVSAYYTLINNDNINDINAILNNINDLIKKINLDEYEKIIQIMSDLKSVDSPRNVIKDTIMLLWDKKYSIKNYTSNYYTKNDIFTMLYILNKMGYSTNKLYNYIYIDEAQDYNDAEIKLLYELEYNPIMNIFGDYNQNILKTTEKRNNWDSLKELLNINYNYYELNENYRNTINVVDYTNNSLNTKMKAIGFAGNDVEVLNCMDIDELISTAKSKDSIVICKNENLLKTLKDSGANAYSVIDVKGLEFKNAIVVDQDCNFNEKYVAYTRSLNDLIVVHSVNTNNNVEDEPLSPVKAEKEEHVTRVVTQETIFNEKVNTIIKHATIDKKIDSDVLRELLLKLSRGDDDLSDKLYEAIVDYGIEEIEK